MVLDHILGSKTKVRILHYLIKNKTSEYFEKELAIACGASISEVHRQIRDLIQFGIVFFQKKGRLKYYRINPAHFLYAPLENLFRAMDEDDV